MDLVDEEKRSARPINPIERVDVTRVAQLEAELNDLRAGTSNMQLAYQDAIMLVESKVKENEHLVKELENLKQERIPKMSPTRDALAFLPSFSSIVDAGMVAFAPPEKRKQPAVLATQLLRSQELQAEEQEKTLTVPKLWTQGMTPREICDEASPSKTRHASPTSSPHSAFSSSCSGYSSSGFRASGAARSSLSCAHLGPGSLPKKSHVDEEWVHTKAKTSPVKQESLLVGRVGMKVRASDRGIIVSGVDEGGSAAATQRVAVGHFLIEVEQHLVTSQSTVDDVRSLFLGEIGTLVRITCLVPTSGETYQVDLIRNGGPAEVKALRDHAHSLRHTVQNQVAEIQDLRALLMESEHVDMLRKRAAEEVLATVQESSFELSAAIQEATACQIEILELREELASKKMLSLSLDSALSASRSEAEAAREELGAWKAESEGLVASLRNELACAQTMVQSLDKASKISQSETVAAREELAAVRIASELEVSSLLEELASAQGLGNAAREELRLLKIENRRELERVQKQLEELDHIVRIEQGRSSDVTSRSIAFQDEAAKLRADLDRARNERVGIAVEVTNIVRILVGQVQDMEGEIDMCCLHTSQSQDESSQAASLLTQTKQQVSNLLSRCEEMELSVESLRGQCSNLIVEKEAAVKDTESARSEAAKFREELKNAHSVINSTKGCVDSLSCELGSAQEHSASLEQELEKFRSQAASDLLRCRDDMLGLREQNNRLQEQSASLIRELSSERDKSDHLERSMSIAQANLSTTKADMEKERRDSAGEISKLKSQISKSEDDMSAMRTKVSTVVDQAASLFKELSAAKIQRDDKARDVEKLASELFSARSALNYMKNGVELVLKELVSAGIESVVLQSELEGMQAKRIDEFVMLEEKVGRLCVQCTQLEEQLSAESRKVFTSEHEREETRKECEKLGACLDKANMDALRLAADLDKVTASIPQQKLGAEEDAKQEVLALAAAHAKEMEHVLSEILEWKSHAEALELDMSRLRDQAAARERECGRIWGDLQIANGELANASVRGDLLEVRLTSLSTELSNCQDRYEKIRVEFQHALRERSKLIDFLDDARDKSGLSLITDSQRSDRAGELKRPEDENARWAADASVRKSLLSRHNYDLDYTWVSRNSYLEEILAHKKHGYDVQQSVRREAVSGILGQSPERSYAGGQSADVLRPCDLEEERVHILGSDGPYRHAYQTSNEVPGVTPLALLSSLTSSASTRSAAGDGWQSLIKDKDHEIGKLAEKLERARQEAGEARERLKRMI